MIVRPSRRRLHAQDPAVAGIRQQVDEAVRALAHVADALAELLQHALFAGDAVAVGFEPRHELARQGADEDAAAPGRELVARVEGHAGGRNGWVPVEDRLLKALLLRTFADL